jgi:hypothetical protein
MCNDAFGASWSLLNELLGEAPPISNAVDEDAFGEKVVAALKVIREDGPIPGKALAKRIHLEFSTLRRHIVPKLKTCGVKNDGDGYYVAPM